MGSYDRWVGDVEDFTDEEVADFNIGAVCRERIVRLRLAWCWCMVRRESSGMNPQESAVADVLVGKSGRRGQLRIYAEELHALVTVSEDGSSFAGLDQWRVDGGASTTARLQKMLKTAPLEDLCTLYKKEVEEVLQLISTMMVAIPRYNRQVNHGLFPEAMWGKGTKQLFNKVLHRLEKELSMWNASIETLSKVSN